MKSVHIVERSLPLAWEKSVMACWEQGESFPTQYDKAGDPNSRDILAMIHVLEPMGEPRIHRAFPGGLNDLEKYRAEVLYGVHDHWGNPAEGKWEYTYHQRLFEYELPDAGHTRIDQMAKCVQLLKECGYTRRAQAVTWKAWEDLGIHDPACLQRVWFRIERGRLNMVVHMRSNDAYKAAFMNMYAFTEMQADIARQVGVPVGEYCHIADSYHIYGSYFEEFKGFVQTVRSRPESERVWDSEFAREMMLDGCEELLGEADMPKDKREMVVRRRTELAGG